MHSHERLPVMFCCCFVVEANCEKMALPMAGSGMAAEEIRSEKHGRDLSAACAKDNQDMTSAKADGQLENRLKNCTAKPCRYCCSNKFTVQQINSVV